MRFRFLPLLVLLGPGFAGDAYAGPCEAVDFDTVIFREDFTGQDSSLPDSDWLINHPDKCWWVQGRTFMPSPTCHPDGPFPHIQDNTCVITHYDYNPYDIDPNDPGNPNHFKTTFLGGEIHTLMQFEPAEYYRFEARVRWPHAPRGLVASFFTYGHYDDVRKESDEIDFEFLSNEVFGSPAQVLTNTWDDSQQKPVQVVMPEGFDLTAWQTFRLYWCPGACVKWTWIDPASGDEVTLRVEEISHIPNEPMSLYFNFWAPTADWAKAYDPSLVPDQQDNGTKYEYFIDYAEVRVPEPAICLVFVPGALWMLARRSRAAR